MPKIPEVIKANAFFGALPYGDEWRNKRRIFQQYFSPKMLHREQNKSLEFIRKALLPNLYQDPEHVYDHVRGFVGGLSIAMTYGLPVRRTQEPLIDLSESFFTASAAAAAPGKYLVNILPVLKHIPGWIPGVTFKKVAQKIREQMYQITEQPYHQTLKSMDGGTAPESFVSESIERYKERQDLTVHEQDIKHVATQVFGAQSETSVNATMTFILAMLTHPDVQHKAQQEVDSVVGSDRLPDFSDQPHLPYLAAVLKEVLRWNPIAPMGVPHMTSKEDVYEGYYIPKGCIIFANAYAMLHDEDIFPNPTEFDPQRFMQDDALSTDILDPTTDATFGFGRRICPGSHIAISTLYITAASILAIFDISPALDSEGKPIKVTPEFISASLVSEPLPFKCKFNPRSGKNVENLLQEYLGLDVIQCSR